MSIVDLKTKLLREISGISEDYRDIEKDLEGIPFEIEFKTLDPEITFKWGRPHRGNNVKDFRLCINGLPVIENKATMRITAHQYLEDFTDYVKFIISNKIEEMKEGKQ